MGWTTPKTWATGDTLDAGTLNTHLRDNLNETAPALATTAGSIMVADGVNSLAERVPSAATVNTSESTTSTTFTDLTTSGPAVTVTTGTQAIVIIGCWLQNNTASDYADMSFAVSGATTRSAKGEESLRSPAGGILAASRVVFVSGLTAGSNTFTAKYRAIGGGTATFQYRHLIVIPL